MATAWRRAHSTALLSRVLLGWRRVAHQRTRVCHGMKRAQQHYQRCVLLGGAFARWRVTTARARKDNVSVGCAV